MPKLKLTASRSITKWCCPTWNARYFRDKPILDSCLCQRAILLIPAVHESCNPNQWHCLLFSSVGRGLQGVWGRSSPFLVVKAVPKLPEPSPNILRGPLSAGASSWLNSKKGDDRSGWKMPFFANFGSFYWVKYSNFDFTMGSISVTMVNSLC